MEKEGLSTESHFRMQRCNGGESCELYLFSSIPKTNPNTATPPPPSTASIQRKKTTNGLIFAPPVVVDLIENPHSLRLEHPRLLLQQGKTERMAADEILFCEPRKPNLVVESQTSN
jgi:hypothetical protein